MQTTHRILLDLEYLQEAERLAIANTPALKLMYQNPWIQWPPRVVLAGALIYFLIENDWFPAGVAGFIIALSFFGTFYSRRSRAKARQRNRLRDSIATFSLDDAGLDTVGKYSNAHIQWPAVIKAMIYPQGVLLKLTPNGFAWLPDQALTDGSPTDVRQLLATHVKDCEQATP